MIKIIQAPNQNKDRYTKVPSLFIAGGITGTSDWQTELLKLLEKQEVLVYNPRRDNYKASDPIVEFEQISWEYEHLGQADAVSFWFPKESLCPITLFELGLMLNHNPYKRIFIGCDPSYSRIRDVKIQVFLRNQRIKIVDSIQDLSDQIIDWIEVCKICEEMRKAFRI